MLIPRLMATLAKLARPVWSWRGGGRIPGDQTPVAHHEASATPCSESDLCGELLSCQN